jgi:response regulator NasT
MGMQPKVLLIDDNAERAEAVRAGLQADGCVVVGHVRNPADLLGLGLIALVRDTSADIVVCDVDNPSRDTIESMQALNRDEPRPVVMFVDRAEPASIHAAMDAGVAAYVVEGLVPSRVKAVIDVAAARFRAHQAMKAELHQARSALAERKQVERAKGILMKSRRLSEEEAYATLRRLAMDQGKRLAEIADSVITLSKMLRD